jgi:hypothetical protein
MHRLPGRHIGRGMAKRGIVLEARGSQYAGPEHIIQLHASTLIQYVEL